MADSGSFSLGFRLDIKQILQEAQNRWLRPAEICEILRNYEKFQICPEAPTRPISGSIFLFDRKVLRYFRKDGHNWRKKKDGKTVKEAHEKLKVGSIDMLHCYYAHGEDNENFQRRSYWLLEQELMHIVFVHYLEVKGSKANMGSLRNSGIAVSNSENSSPMSSSFRGASPTSTLSSGYEDAESEDSHQASSRLHPEFLMAANSHSALSSSYNHLARPGNQSVSVLSHESVSWGRDGELGVGNVKHETQVSVDSASWQGNSSTGEFAYKQEPVPDDWKHPFEDNAMQLHNTNMNQTSMFNLPQANENTLFEEKYLPSSQGNSQELFYTIPNELSNQMNFQMNPLDAQIENPSNLTLDDIMRSIVNDNYSFTKKPFISGLQTEESLKKVDSFSRWMTKELGEGDELNMQLNNGFSWSMMGSEYDSNMTADLQVDAETLSPSISRDQLFSILKFSPSWAYSNLDTKVLIAGKFLKSPEELPRCRWSIMFGEVEVQAEVLANGILCCHAPLHKPGLVPFYITCSNRLGCSEIREFEYRLGPTRINCADAIEESVIVMHLYQRLEMIMCLAPIDSPVSSTLNDLEKQNVVNTIVSLLEEENNEDSSLTSNDTSSLLVIGQLLIEKDLKGKFFSWIINSVTEVGKGPTVVDEGGQSVLHLTAALGFNWALQPIIVAGVSIDFRDVNGWTALHWAAFYGREDTVVALVSLGASPGALTDPCTEHPLGRTPADLASSSGHKGISGFLAESTLTSHLSKLEVRDQDGTSEVSGIKAIQSISERTPVTGEDVPDTLSLKDSLAAVCNATQAAARIQQIFRVQSFQRKQLKGSNDFLTPDEHAISLIGAKTSRLGRPDGAANSAALSIQKKFRGYSKRKEFLSIREKIVKIQAHVRGHQARKKYKPIICWSVGILEKVILRWRRKRSGLRGFRSDAGANGTHTEGSSLPQEDDYDFLKEGRKQNEERMATALSRVRSMANYPEARAQYRRLLTASEEIRESKDISDVLGVNPTDVIPETIDEAIYPEDDLIDLEALFDDDTFMSLAFQ